MTTEKAILAGGCFWGMEELFRHRPGLVSTRVGYSGGDVLNATYGNDAESMEAVSEHRHAGVGACGDRHRVARTQVYRHPAARTRGSAKDEQSAHRSERMSR